MRTVTPERREDVRDPIGLVGWPREKGRDGERTPMQWSTGRQAGFSTNPRPWLPVNADYARVNVAVQRGDPASLLRWTRRLIALRRSEPSLRDGAMTLLPATPPDVLAWTRRSAEGAPVMVAINMGSAARTIAVAGKASATLAASNRATGPDQSGRRILLPPFATWVGRVAEVAD